MSRAGSAKSWSLLAAFIGALIVAIAAIFWTRAVALAFLFAFFLWISIPLGAQALLLLHALTGGRWGDQLRCELLALASTLPLMACLLVLPLVAHALLLHPGVADGAASFRAVYYAPPVLILRTLLVIALCVFGGWFVVWHTRRNAERKGVRARGIGATGLLLYSLSMTIAAYDWIAALQTDWYSSVVGLYVLIGQPLAALCVAVLLTLAARGSGSALPELPEEYRNRPLIIDWGNLILMLVVLHAYLAYSQFFIIWNGNLPDEIHWYLPRMRGGWGLIAFTIILLHFAFPFLTLLFRSVKRRPRMLRAVICIILTARVLDVLWMVIPSATGAEQFLALLLSAPAAVAIGGFWLWLLFRPPGLPARVRADKRLRGALP